MSRWQDLVERLLEERGARLVAYASLLVGRDGDAEDLVHDAIVKVFSRPRPLRTVDEAEALRAFGHAEHCDRRGTIRVEQTPRVDTRVRPRAVASRP